MSEKIYEITQLPPGSEKNFLKVNSLDPSIHDENTVWQKVRHIRGTFRGRKQPDIAGFQSSVFRFKDDDGNTKVVLATKRLDRDGREIKDSTVRLTFIPVRNK